MSTTLPASKEDLLKSIPATGYQEPAADCDPDAFRRVVESRRAVRIFDGTPVPEATMREALELALLSPSSSNLQPAEMYWVRDPAVRRELVAACLGQPAAATAQELVVFVARKGSWRGVAKGVLAELEKVPGIPPKPLDYYRKLVPFAMTQGPLGLLGAAKRLVLHARGLFRPTPRGPASKADMRVWASTSTALAAQTFMLAVRAAGFDTCPMGGFDACRVRRLLDLPADAEVLMVVSVGRRAPGGVYGPRLRLASERFVHVV